MSSSEDTLQDICNLAAENFGGDPAALDPDAPIQQLGADSLGYLEFLFELEGHFEITIEQETVAKVKTLRELAALVDQLKAARTGPSDVGNGDSPK